MKSSHKEPVDTVVQSLGFIKHSEADSEGPRSQRRVNEEQKLYISGRGPKRLQATEDSSSLPKNSA